MKRFLTGVVFLSFVLAASAGWAEPKAEQARQGDAQAAFTKGTASKEGAYNEMVQFAKCSGFYEFGTARFKYRKGKQEQQAYRGLMWAAMHFKKVSLFFGKPYFETAEKDVEKIRVETKKSIAAMNDNDANIPDLLRAMGVECEAKLELGTTVLIEMEQGL